MNTEPTPIPEGFRENASGHLVPVSQIKEVDLARDSLVVEVVEQAKQLGGMVSKFKGRSLDDIQAFVELSAEKYGAKLGGRRGNVTLSSFDGRYKIDRAISDSLEFSEQLQAAKALIDECLNEWSEGSRSELKTIIQDAFKTDKKGKLDTRTILGLRKFQFQNEKWNRAMEAINDSLTVSSSKTYIRFYERNDSGQYIQIALDPTEL